MVFRNLNFIYIYIFERQGERESFHALVCSPNGCNRQGWARSQLEPGTQTGYPRWVIEIQVCQPSTAASRVLISRKQGLDSIRNVIGTLIGNVGIPSGVLTAVPNAHTGR